MKATIHDLANLSGVSTSTVSRVLTGNGSVSKEARERVEEAIRATGYVPNGFARGLVNKRRHLIAAIVPERYNPYYDPIVEEINEVALQNGYSLVLITEMGKACRSTVEKVIEMGIDGLLHLGALEGDDVVPLLIRNEVPFVLLCRQLSTVDADMVLFDDRATSFMATEYLIQLGHRKIAYIYGRRNSLSSREKYLGYAAALEKHGISVDAGLVGYGNLDMSESYHVMNEFLSARDAGCLSFTAVVAGNDLMLFGAREAVLKRGLRIPEDLSMIGMDGIEWCAIQGVELTTVNVPKREMGRRACELLLKRIENPKGKHEVQILETQLKIRKSCCERRGDSL